MSELDLQVSEAGVVVSGGVTANADEVEEVVVVVTGAQTGVREPPFIFSVTYPLHKPGPQ